jgi:cytochrome c551/c552
MNRFNKLIPVLLLILSACGGRTSKNQSDQDILKKGSELFSKYGCNICHTFDGSVLYGPPLNEIYMTEIMVIREGKEKSIVADREYLKRAIVDPRYEKVLEYQNKEMPVTFISDEEADILTDYIIAMSEGKMMEK